LKIYSEVGHGTTVKLYLPRAPAVPPGAPAPEVPQKHAPGTETILVVEDEDAVRKLVVRHLRSLGYRVIEAAEGATAAELLRGDEKIDLLFTDVVLPGGMTGRQLAEEARALRPDLQVLFTSGYTQNSIAHQGKLDFGVHLLSKPYRREDLRRKIREVLGAGKDR
jgi:CheY-like chemotaxis protein